MDLPDFLTMAGITGHTVTIEPYLGAGAAGDTYGPAVTVTGFTDRVRRRTMGTTGTEQLADTRVFVPLDTDCPVGSRVTVNGIPGRVAAVMRRDSAGVEDVPQHLELTVN